MKQRNGTDLCPSREHDLVRSDMPYCWQDGFVLGNGSLGAVVCAPGDLEWIVNKADVIDARTAQPGTVLPRAEAEALASRGASGAEFAAREVAMPPPPGAGPKSCCVLSWDMGRDAGSGTANAMPALTGRLKLRDGELDIRADKHLSHPVVSTLVVRDDDVMAVRIRNVSPFTGFHQHLYLTRPEEDGIAPHRLRREGNTLFLEQELPGAVRYVVAVRVVSRPAVAYRELLPQLLRPAYHPDRAGAVTATVEGAFGHWHIAGDSECFVTVVSDCDADDLTVEARSRLDRAEQDGYAGLARRCRRWWHGFWRQSRIRLEDAALERRFYRSLYVLAVSCGPAPVPGLTGLCYGPSRRPRQVSPWHGDLHLDQNAQCPLYPVHILNHSELAQGYLETFHSFLPEARRLAREVFGVGGAHFDMAFQTRGRSVFGGVGTYRFALMGSYVALIFCRAWQFRRDRGQLRELIYPFLREILQFYREVADTSGPEWHWRFTHVCELEAMDTGDSVQTVSMLRYDLTAAVDMAEELGLGGEAAQWRDFLTHLPAYPAGTDRRGRRIVLDGGNVNPDHYISQANALYPVFPCGEIEPGDALYCDTFQHIEESIAQISYANPGGWHFQCVWQCFHMAASALRLGLVEAFHQRYWPMFLAAYAKPNGWFSHDACVIAPFRDTERNLARIPGGYLIAGAERMPKTEPWCGCYGSTSPNPEAKKFAAPALEGSGDFLTLIAEMLLRRRGDVIELFPAWPLRQAAEFEHFRVEGDLLVSAAWVPGRPAEFRVERGPNCRLRRIRVKLPRSKKLHTIEWNE